MPDNRPMPLTGEERIDDDPVLGQAIDNFPSRRFRALLYGWSSIAVVALLLNLGFWNVEGQWVGVVGVTSMTIYSLAVGWWIMHQWNLEVIVYERGFTYREGSVNVPFLYAEVKSIRLRAEQLAYFGGLVRRAVYRVTITMHSDEQIVLNNTYSRIERLSDLIIARVNNVLRPNVRELFASGAWVPFTAYLFVSQTGIRVDASELEGAADDPLLLWQDFHGYEIKGGKLRIMTHDNRTWFEVPLAEVDNITLLLELLRQQSNVQETAV